MIIDELELIEKNVSQILYKSVIPIFQKDTNKKMKLLGTGIYLAIESRLFVLSAAHILNETLEVYYADTMEHMSTIPYRYFKKQENIDLGIYLLKNKLENFYLPLELDISDNIPDYNQYFLLGYPGTQSKYYENKMHSALRTFITKKESNPQIEIKAFELALSFTRQKTYNNKNQRQRFPIPNGMSGGPVFTFHKNKNSVIYSLFGLLTRYDAINDKTLIATRIEIINEFIRRTIIEIEKHDKK